MTSAQAETLPFGGKWHPEGLVGWIFCGKEALSANAAELRSAGQPMAAVPTCWGTRL